MLVSRRRYRYAPECKERTVRKAVIRTLKVEDLVAMVRVEREAWPVDVRASREQLEDRLMTFGEGAFGAFLGPDLVATATSQIVCFAESDAPPTWAELTANGWISRTHGADGNCLHAVSTCVCPEHRGRGIAGELIQARVDLGLRLGLTHAMTCARLPGLSKYLTESPDGSAEAYVGNILRGTVIEPAVAIYLHRGFRPIGLVPKCMRSDVESDNFGLALLMNLQSR